MLFHTQEFVFLYLLPLLGLFYVCVTRRQARLNILLLASYAFYAYWDVRFLPLLLVSTLLNWWISKSYFQLHLKWKVYLGIGINLGLIGLFKYADFLGGSLYWVIQQPYEPLDIILPLGISFFTFQQISYLVDLHKGQARAHDLGEYALYVAFFPQLIAGPIVRHHELIDQFKLDPLRDGLHQRIAFGLAFFTIGLFKKIILSDSAAATADPLFAKSLTSALSFSESWSAVWAFSLQIYFDFSGYSDMAIGLALLFGISLPFNFNSPYKAVSIQDFWRRWHMTLSRFLRDYLYIPLGGSHFGPVRQALALFVTMFLGGLWHGASWTFVVWGVAHGLALIVCAQWQRLNVLMPRIIGFLLTLAFVSVVWIFFRAETFTSAMNVFSGLLAPLDHSHWPDGKKLWIMVVGTGVIFLLPSSQKFIHSYLRPYRFLAVVLAGFAFVAMIRSGGIYYEDFIYFQF